MIIVHFLDTFGIMISIQLIRFMNMLLTIYISFCRNKVRHWLTLIIISIIIYYSIISLHVHKHTHDFSIYCYYNMITHIYNNYFLKHFIINWEFLNDFFLFEILWTLCSFPATELSITILLVYYVDWRNQ